MEWKKEPPTAEGWYRARGFDGSLVVCELLNGKFHIAQITEPQSPQQMVAMQWLFGPRVEFDNTLADYRCSYGLYEQAFCAALGGILAYQGGDDAILVIREAVENAKRHATEAIKVMAEGNQ